jgi:hypothetical protein
VTARERIGIALSAAAVAAVGAVGVWIGLAATSVPSVDLGDTVNDIVAVSTDTSDAAISVEWRLHRGGDVSLTASLVSPGIELPSDFPIGESARIAIELACDARLQGVSPPDGVELIEDGSEAGCGADPAEDALPARQIFVMTLADEFVEVTGHPVREWSTSLAGQSTARTPRMILATGGFIDPALPFDMVTPGRYSSLSAVLEAGPKDLLDLTVTPAGDVVEATGIMVQSDGDRTWVDSVRWSLEFQTLAQQSSLEEGLARWTDPTGQTLMQLLLLLSGALIGVAASLAVERLFAWTLRARRAAPGDGEGAPPEGDAPVTLSDS